VERRSKEIATRKVLGCNRSGMFYLLSAYFIEEIFTAIGIAFPVAYLITKN
jgi:putative ABC transport system permease protein